MADLPRVLLALLSLVGLTTAIIPGLMLGPGQGGGFPLGGGFGAPGKSLLGGLLGGSPPGRSHGGSSRSPGSQVFRIGAGPLGTGGGGMLPGLGGPLGPAGNLLGSLLSGMPIVGGPPGLVPGGGGQESGPAAPGHTPGGSGPADDAEARPASPGGGSGSRLSGVGAGGSGSSADSSEEIVTKKKSDTNRDGSSSGGSRGPEKPQERGAAGSSVSRRNGDSSEETETSGGSRRRYNAPRRRGTGGSNGSRSNEGSSEETKTKKKSTSSEDSADSTENKPSRQRKRRPRLGRRRSGGTRREKRSFMDEFGLMGTKSAHHALDNVPDHVKVVYCGRHEVPNPGGIEDHFCHPDATWDTLLRMRPDCVCQQGFLRNSWGECISPAECDHCSDKHHLNMDYHLCESPCPIVCNQPIDENCPNTCFKECACRPGYIRAYPNGPCVSIKQCLPGCRGRNQIFSLCSSLCPPTCRKPVPKRCPNICAGEGCVCKPGYVVKKWEPLVCVRPENCPGRRKKCPGPNQRYSRCIRRCAPSCFRRRHRYCGHDCLGRGCVCKRGYVVLQRRPLVCVRREECPARRKKCPARNQVYMYCKSKCPRTCEEPKPRKCGSACEGEGCACKPGYVMKQEDPLLCVRRYQCDLEDMGLKGSKGSMGAVGAMGAKGSMGVTGAMEAVGAKGAMGATGAMEAMGAKGAMGATGAMEAKGVKGAKSSSTYPPLPSWPSPSNYF